jgi:hypothetical protein
MGEKIMKRLFEKQKYIETVFEDRHIENLNKANVPYVIKERRVITSYARLLYFCYSILLDLTILFGIVWALFNYGLPF